MTESFAEYRGISVTDPLRQGDVLEAVDASASMWQRHLIIITADCDLAFGKHQGRVTCIPLLTASEYLLETQIPRIRERFTKKAIASLRKVLLADGERISDERLIEWPSEATPIEIVAALGLEGRVADNAKLIFESIRLISSPAMTLPEAIELAVSAHLAMPDPQKRANVIRTITETLKSPYSQPPGDALFLSAIAPSHDGGYFAYLRHLEQLLEVDIATGPARRSARYRRLSCLKDRYTHALVQRFALVFMSIGLPKEYEEIRDLHSEVMGETYQ